MKEQIQKATEFTLDSISYSTLVSLLIRRKNVALELLKEDDSDEAMKEFIYLNNLIKDLLAL